ncbi:tetratricopeptide repeat protein [Pseudoalteromonas umbrosa]|uniref:tetratricopeptide repeat protein n=1 Tax=Pseudoalteromonas umbrosa TaxID=3048489 RepID=UPI0024C34963|nr:tetratricopeptide repeat protein [Pseudoalteromonas sp. B95]MDK1288156.1 tetratricopeptide repeat protein [Pseudoalteromonas sp. B95]
MIGQVVIIAIGLLFSSILNASPSIEQQMEMLQEAEDYLTVKPSQSLRILALSSDVEKLPLGLQIRWHVLRVRASVPTNQLMLLEQSLKALFAFSAHPYFEDKLPSILSALGIWLRRKGHLQEADISLQCALQYAQNESQRLTLINSRALVARHMGKYPDAISLYQEAALLAQQQHNASMMATINNNLGAIALDLANYDEADVYFRAALAGYQRIDKRSGHITAGTNLLFLFLLKGEMLNYQRLYSPIKALTDGFPNQSKKALLTWINTAHLVKQGGHISGQARQNLQVAYTQLESHQVKLLVVTHLVPIVQVTLPALPTRKSTPFLAPWFKKVQDCRW